MAKAVATETAPAKNYDGVFAKIDGLSGKEKYHFCRTLSKEEKEAYVKFCRDRDTRMVTGIFRSFEPVGGSVVFNARPYEGIENKFTMFDGQEYTIPLCVAKRLNSEWQGCGTWHPTNSHILDAAGNPTVNVGKKNYRFAFMSADFS